jgi:O-antigen/teichoic acid export membrane protein
MALYSRERARAALVHTVGFRVLSQVATVLNVIVLVRAMTVHDMGIYSLLYSVIPLLSALASLGLDQTQRRFQPEYLLQGNQRGSAWLVRYVGAGRLLANSALIVLLLLAWQWIAPFFKLQNHRADFAFLSIALVLYFQVIVLQCSLAAHMLQRYGVSSAVVLSVGKLLGYIAMMSGGLTLREAILADTLAFVAAYLYLFYVHWRLCRPPPGSAPYHPEVEERRRIRRFATMSNLSDASSLMLYSQTDNLFIGALMNPIAVGAYAFYVRLNEMTYNLIPIRLFENVIQPLLFSVRREEAAQRLPRYFTFLVDISALVQLPLFAFSLAYHHELVQLLFGGKFIDYSPLLPLIVGLAFSDNVISGPVTMVAQYSERTSIIFRSQIFGLYQIAAMLTLIPIAGLYGAALATGTLHLFRNLWVWWKVHELARWSHWRSVLLWGPVIWGGAVLVCEVLKRVLGPQPLLNMVVGALVFLAAALLYLRGPAFSASDREIMTNVFHGKEARLLGRLGVLRDSSGGRRGG